MITCNVHANVNSMWKHNRTLPSAAANAKCLPLCRKYDLELGMDTLTPIASAHERVRTWQAVSGKAVRLEIGDVTDWEFVAQVRGQYG